VRTWIPIGFVLGAALFVALLSWRGLEPVIAAMAVAGWGLIPIVAFHLVPMTADARRAGRPWARSSGCAGLASP